MYDIEVKRLNNHVRYKAWFNSYFGLSSCWLYWKVCIRWLSEICCVHICWTNRLPCGNKTQVWYLVKMLCFFKLNLTPFFILKMVQLCLNQKIFFQQKFGCLNDQLALNRKWCDEHNRFPIAVLFCCLNTFSLFLKQCFVLFFLCARLLIFVNYFWIFFL